jgi:hypothetical protein
MFEMEMVETVALIDYHDKTNKQLSFKKNQLISIDKKFKFKSIRYDSQHFSSISTTPSPSIDLPTLSCQSTNDHQHSTSPFEIDRTLREVLSGIEKCHVQCFHSNIQQEIDAPDLVLNLPIITPRSSKSLDEHIPIIHSTIIIDLQPPPSSSSEQKKIPPPVMKKPEKTMQLMKRLGLYSISGSSKATEV